ncbi:hypothetical protein [Blautia sp. An81]|uniref:hypothetical protein n=1 Tax=Blautia sp. An81 TaxID=1965659 RepID=UPI000B3AB89D|nr:hypothetical protein [Blautia sp. An81]OUN26523.1 hypothetical protein B5G33_16385 [Blautia sp. An81]
MRYLLQNCFSNELTARQQYIEKSIHLWCFPQTSIAGFEQLVSIPSTSLDVFFIVGHNIAVSLYLRSNNISEKTIVAITCGGTIDFSWCKSLNKDIYFPKQNSYGYANLLKGNMFGFKFDLTESEILLYNTRKNPNFYDRLDTCFTKI